MIDLDTDPRYEDRRQIEMLLADLLRGLQIERRFSCLLRATIDGAQRDFRITYVGPSRLRRKARRPSMTDSKKGSKQS